ncbi:LuxR C-terminal-related transcriptional regulator [Agromyces bracchium]|nr:response regulator transcription factor [Agromyces bracchium]
MIEVVLVAPVRAYREAITAAFAVGEEFHIVSHGQTVVEAMSCVAPRHPHVTLVDFALSDFLGVLRAARGLAPSTLLVGYGIDVSRHQTDLVLRAAEAGLTAFVEAEQPIDDIAAAVRLALRGESSCSPRVATILLQAMRRHPEPPRSPLAVIGAAELTPRERVVADLVARGLTNRQIASRLVVGESTVKTHVHSVLAKLGVAHRTEIPVGIDAFVPATRASHPVEVEVESRP